MALFDDKVKKQLQGFLSNMKERVNIIFFTHELECGVCKDVNDFLKEFASLTDKLSLTVFDFEKDKEKVSFYGVERIPAVILLDKDDRDLGIKYYGVPAGYEINSFLSTINELAGNRQDFSEAILKRIRAIDKDIHIQVFISLTCPYCAQAVALSHRLAMENKRIKADMVDSGLFQHLAVKYNISSVPKIVINEKIELLGAVPVETLLENIEKA